MRHTADGLLPFRDTGIAQAVSFMLDRFGDPRMSLLLTNAGERTSQ